MKVRIAFFIAVAFLLHAGSVDAQRKGAAPRAKVFTARQIAEKVLPSVVLIITQDENGNPLSQGSGFVYKSGLVVSNLHVFERATGAIVKSVKTGRTATATEVVAMNAKEDLVVFRIDTFEIPPLSIGDSSLVRTGDEIYVASNPKGLEATFSKGIVSSIRQEADLIQIDAAISQGSSGGPLVNASAEVVGIVKSSLVSGQNLNFAIPIDLLKRLPHKFQHQIQVAGACAFRDSKKDGLFGMVKTVVEKKYYRTVENGRLVERGLLPISITTFDLDGNEIEYTSFDYYGKSAMKFRYTRDENGLLVSYGLETGSLTGLTQSEFFRAAASIVRAQAGEPLKPEDAILNKLVNRRFSQLLRWEDINSTAIQAGPFGSQSFDRNGKLTSVKYENDATRTYEYDSNGRLLRAFQLDKSGSVEIVSRYSYKIDTIGNWIERKEVENYPNLRPGGTIGRHDWLDGETVFREIQYFSQ